MNPRLLLFALAMPLAGGLLLPLPEPARAAGPPFRITFLPLSHGSATLLEVPGGMKMLEGAGAAEDAPELLRVLKQQGVSRLDALALPSWTSGSIGGATALLEAIPTAQVFPNPIVPPGTRNEAVRKKLLRMEREKRLKIARPPSGDVLTLFYTPPCQMRMVSPFGPMLRRFAGDAACSLVLEISYERISYLGLGQTTPKHQQAFWNVTPTRPDGEILCVGRNGAADALSPSLLKPLKTQVAVIPVPRKGSAKPAPSTLKTLRQAGVRVYRTDTQGTVTVVTDGTSIKVTTER